MLALGAQLHLNATLEQMHSSAPNPNPFNIDICCYLTFAGTTKNQTVLCFILAG